jgi:hypothetical protein
VKLLIEKGVKPDFKSNSRLKSNSGWTLLVCAAENSGKAVVNPSIPQQQKRFHRAGVRH